MDRSEARGVAAAALSSALGGTAVAATRGVVDAIDPVPLAFARYLIGAAVLLTAARFLTDARIARADRPAVIGLGVLFFAVFPVLFNLSLSHTTAPRGALALSTLPVLTLLLSAILRAEPLTGTKVAGVLAAMGGVALALVEDLDASPPGAWRGDLIMVGTALTGAVFTVLSRPYIARYGPVTLIGQAMIAGALALALALPLTADVAVPPDISAGQGVVVAYLGVFGAALAFLLWGYGLAHTTPTRVAVTITVNPVMAMLCAALFLGEPVTPALLGGLAAVALGIVLTTRGGASPAPSRSRP